MYNCPNYVIRFVLIDYYFVSFPPFPWFLVTFLTIPTTFILFSCHFYSLYPLYPHAFACKKNALPGMNSSFLNWRERIFPAVLWLVLYVGNTCSDITITMSTSNKFFFLIIWMSFSPLSLYYTWDFILFSTYCSLGLKALLSWPLPISSPLLYTLGFRKASIWRPIPLTFKHLPSIMDSA